MSLDFISRMLGMVFFAIVGARFGLSASGTLSLPDVGASFLFGLVGTLFGLIMTPWLTVRPVLLVLRAVNAMSIEKLLITLLGLAVGLALGLLAAYPLSLLPTELGALSPPIVSVVLAYLLMSIFNRRAVEIWGVLGRRPAAGSKARLDPMSIGSERQLLLDTSVLIDGRIVDIAKTGFIGGTLVVPRFVISELHRVADSSDTQRRARGKRGLIKLNELQRDGMMPFKIVEEDVEEEREVDDKLIALAIRSGAPIITIDFPMNKVASAQGVMVLNINALANAVRSLYIPGETFAIRIIQEGKENNQGVGYLEDGTMVIVENGKPFMDRTIYVEVTKAITKETGRIIFAVPEDRNRPRPAVGVE
jgi:uncharacterized protein YacL